ncbi:MAG TPA: type II secretion system F family protein [Dehalococcoidia bacterium]|nr:type II secretion system F family protein [Dehalococcoidia bacterium]
MTTVVVALFAFYGSAMPQSQAVRGRLQGLMAGTSVVDVTGGVPGALRTTRQGGLFGDLFKGDNESLGLQLERADMSLQPGEFIALKIGLALVSFIAPVFVIPGITAWIVGAVAAVVLYNLPRFYLNHKLKARVDKLNAQLPEALSIISNALKAGFGLLQALDNAADQLSHPISTEFERTIHEMNVGSSAEEALVALTERAGSYDLDIVVTAILVQRTVGGNLGEILDTVADTMRERIRIRGEIKTLTAQQKLTGLVIGFIPIGVGVLFQIMSPGYIEPLFTTFIGRFMIGMAVVLEVVGVMIINRILNIEV